jgi:hypothetical protein
LGIRSEGIKLVSMTKVRPNEVEQLAELLVLKLKPDSGPGTCSCELHFRVGRRDDK